MIFIILHFSFFDISLLTDFAFICVRYETFTCNKYKLKFKFTGPQCKYEMQRMNKNKNIEKYVQFVARSSQHFNENKNTKLK